MRVGLADDLLAGAGFGFVGFITLAGMPAALIAFAFGNGNGRTMIRNWPSPAKYAAESVPTPNTSVR